MTENIRQQNEGIVSWLRRLSARIDRLEKGDKGVRVNDTRIGDLVLASNANTNQIEARNLNTGAITPISSSRETVFSWSGAVEGGGTGVDYISPPEMAPDTTVAHEIILAVSDYPGMPTGSVVVGVNFGDGGLEIITKLTISSSLKSRVRPINVPVNKNDRLWVRLICITEGAVSNLSATIRYGEPYAGWDNTTQDSCGV